VVRFGSNHTEIDPRMITGEIRSQVDRIWDAFWSGGISNPLEVIEQITYLLFLRRLDELQTLKENAANRLKQPIEGRIFPKGKNEQSMRYEDMRWSNSRTTTPERCSASSTSMCFHSCAS
jgi:type I restriction enzyme M protein